MQLSRMDAWAEAINACSGLDVNICDPMRYLAKLDCELQELMPRVGSLKGKEDLSLPEIELIHDALGKAYFWVLGAYEIVRTLDARYRQQHRLTNSESTLFSAIKVELERLRIPIAKLEPARKFAATDYAYPRPRLNEVNGIGWSTSDNTMIQFQELSHLVLGSFGWLAAEQAQESDT